MLGCIGFVLLLSLGVSPFGALCFSVEWLWSANQIRSSESLCCVVWIDLLPAMVRPAVVPGSSAFKSSQSRSVLQWLSVPSLGCCIAFRRVQCHSSSGFSFCFSLSFVMCPLFWKVCSSGLAFLVSLPLLVSLCFWGVMPVSLSFFNSIYP